MKTKIRSKRMNEMSCDCNVFLYETENREEKKCLKRHEFFFS